MHQSLRLIARAAKVHLERREKDQPWHDLQHGIEIRNGREALADTLDDEMDGHCFSRRAPGIVERVCGWSSQKRN